MTQGRGGHAAIEKEQNVRSLVRGAVSDLIREGGRICEAMSGESMSSIEQCEEPVWSENAHGENISDTDNLGVEKTELSLLAGRLNDVKVSVGEVDEDLTSMMEALDM